MNHNGELWPFNSTLADLCAVPMLERSLHLYSASSTGRTPNLRVNRLWSYSHLKPLWPSVLCVTFPSAFTEHRCVLFLDHSMCLIDSPRRDEDTSQFRTTSCPHSAVTLGIGLSCTNSASGLETTFTWRFSEATSVTSLQGVYSPCLVGLVTVNRKRKTGQAGILIVTCFALKVVTSLRNQMETFTLLNVILPSYRWAKLTSRGLVLVLCSSRGFEVSESFCVPVPVCCPSQYLR